MSKSYLLAAAALVAFAVPAQAALQVTGTTRNNNVTAIDSDNDFKTQLGLLTPGLTQQATNYTVSVIGAPLEISVYRVGAESALDNVVRIDGSTFGENNEMWSLGSLLIQYSQGTSGALSGNISFFSNGSGQGQTLGAGNVAVFLPANSGLDLANHTFTYTSDSLFFGFNDNGSSDADYDDYVIKITSSVPEPATWGLMLVGFGLTGAAIRRRNIRTSVRFA